MAAPGVREEQGPFRAGAGGALSSPLKEFRHAATAEGSRGIRRNFLPNQPPFAAAANSLRTTPLAYHAWHYPE